MFCLLAEAKSLPMVDECVRRGRPGQMILDAGLDGQTVDWQIESGTKKSRRAALFMTATNGQWGEGEASGPRE